MSLDKSNIFKTSALLATAVSIAVPQAIAADLRGQVTAGGEPVEGALLTVEETGQTVATGPDGSYRFNNIDAGDYTIEVSYIGAEGQLETVTVTEDQTAALNFALDEAEKVMDSVIVTGQRGSLFAGINQQRAADNLISVLSADAIGQFPDQNVAESVRRIAGITVLNDQGEGRFVSIRGLGPDLNAVSLNGVRIGAPELGTRAVALDVIDADILDSIEITKSLNADQDGDGIGGSINIKTMTAFDRSSPFISFKAEGIYTESSEDLGPKLSLTGSNVFLDGALGLAGSVSLRNQRRINPNFEGDGVVFDEDDGLIFPEQLEQRYYDVERERISTAFNIDYKLGDNTDLFARTIYNKFEDQEFRNRVEYTFEDGDLDTRITDNNGNLTFAVGPEDFEIVNEGTEEEEKLIAQIEVDRDSKDRLETQEIWSVQLGGQTRRDVWTFDYSAAYSHAEEEEPDRVDATFRAKAKGGEDDDFQIILDNIDPTEPRVVSASPFFSDAGEFGFDELEFINGLAEDDELALTFDVKRDMNLFGGPGFVKAGVKSRMREKSFDATVLVFDGLDLDDDTLTPFVFNPEYPFGNFGPAPNSRAVRDFYLAQPGVFEESAGDSALASFAEDFDAEENIIAGYLMAQAEYGPALVTGGVRIENTDFEGNGFFVTEFEGDVTAAPGGELVGGDPEEGVYAERRTGSQDYTDILPSVNVRYEFSDNVLARAAFYSSIVRPNLFQASPAAELEFDGEAWEAGSIGNPDLDRQTADNFDIALEWYPTNQGVLSAGVFYKQIDDFIAEVVFDNYQAFGITFDEATTFVNLDQAEVTGVELNAQQAFDGILPGVLGGLILGANYTYIDSETSFTSEGVTRDIALPGMSDETANFVIGYDKFGLDLRLAYNYRSEYLDELSSDGESDRFYNGRGQLDFTAKYDVNANVSALLEVANITDEEEHAVLRTPIGDGLSQYDQYGYTVKFGFRIRN